jgi:hypothetical protein
VKSGNLNFLEPSGPLQACNRTALLFTFTGGDDTVAHCIIVTNLHHNSPRLSSTHTSLHRTITQTIILTSDILHSLPLCKPWILTKHYTVFNCGLWFQDIKIVFAFLSPPWRRQHEWPKHDGDYYVIKLQLIKPSSFVGPFKKYNVPSKFSLHFGNVSFLNTRVLGVFLLRGLLRAPESVHSSRWDASRASANISWDRQEVSFCARLQAAWNSRTDSNVW